MFDQYRADAMNNPYAPTNEDLWDHGEGAEMSITDVLFTFDGRIPRSTYWLAHLGTVFTLGLTYFAAMAISEDLFTFTVFLSLIPAIWIGLAIEIKRWHDLGMSGWWTLIGFIPYLGGFIKLIALGFMPSDGPNQYGPVPR
ncbi:MAG: DUF805 domain-containing protein [Alphaproteobacteria bacterium]|nr:DUF805 domain-containing protein [Alphaproteobacteria bacterium]